MTSWDWLTFITKVAIYLGTAGVIGGLFSLWLLQQHNRQRLLLVYVRRACALGLGATLVYFPVQVGAFADRGMAGMLDWDIARVLHQTGVGSASRGWLLGFTLILVASFGLYRQRFLPRLAAYFNGTVGVAALLYAYSAIGHLQQTGWLGQMLVAIHVAAVAWWLGSLYPLWRVTRTQDLTRLQQSMQRFGQIAMFVVAGLVLSGVLMSYLLLNQPLDLFATTYGRGLLLKITLVAGLLLVAASHKWLLVPRLLQPGYSQRLARSIQLEMVVGLGVLLVIASLTTFTGPA